MNFQASYPNVVGYARSEQPGDVAHATIVQGTGCYRVIIVAAPDWGCIPAVEVVEVQTIGDAMDWVNGALNAPVWADRRG